jgi:FkbM family methyltransferase
MPIRSIFSSKLPFTVFFPGAKGPRMLLRFRVLDAKSFSIDALEYFRKYVPKKGDLCLDVGGEFGFETLQLSHLVGPEGRVYVFECLPDHLAHLEQIAAASGNIVLVRKACWNKNETIAFHIGNTPGSGTLIGDAKGQRGQTLASTKQLEVTAITLDDFWRAELNSQVVTFMKMDIEGSEYEALDGAKEVLKNTSNVVIASYHIRDGVPTAAIVQSKLNSAGFHTRVDENLHVYGWRS